MYEIMEKHEGIAHWVVIFYEYNGHKVTVFSGTIEDWNMQNHPFRYSSIWKSNTEMQGNTLFIEILDA